MIQSSQHPLMSMVWVSQAGADQLLQSTPQCMGRCCWGVPGRHSHCISSPWVCPVLSIQTLLCTPGSKDFIIKEGKVIHEETEKK